MGDRRDHVSLALAMLSCVFPGSFLTWAAIEQLANNVIVSTYVEISLSYDFIYIYGLYGTLCNKVC